MRRERRATVFVADDHPLFRDGVTRALRGRADLELVGEADDGRAALAAIRELLPDVALVDLRMPVVDGLQLLGALERDGLPTAVVILSAHTGADLIYRSISLGARAYLPKDISRDDICDAVSAVARGETWLPPEVQAQLINGVRRNAGTPRAKLTAREHEVLIRVANGMSAPDIGTELSLSTATIKSHLVTLYEKLGVSDRAHAVATAMRQGLLE